MARSNTTNSSAINYGKLVYSPDEYSSSDDMLVNIAPKSLEIEASSPNYTTVCHFYSILPSSRLT